MFESFSIYLGIGLLIGLAGFLLLFRKWDLPRMLREKFQLNTRMKAIVYVLLQGVLLAILLSLLVAMLGFSTAVGDVLTGLAIGLNCAILAGVLQPPEKNAGSPAGNRGTNTAKSSSSGGGRRRKG